MAVAVGSSEAKGEDVCVWVTLGRTGFAYDIYRRSRLGVLSSLFLEKVCKTFQGVSVGC